MAAGIPPVTYRVARLEHADAIHVLLADATRAGLVLPRPITEIRSRIDDFVVALDTLRQVAGCVALRDYGQGLFEVRSLVVDQAWRWQGIGTLLVKRVVRAARDRGGHSLFALTYHPDLFRRLDFKVVPKELFPHKVWADCRHCSKRDCCDEIALVLDLAT